MELECEGECPCNTDPCNCGYDWNPVCGVDGVTYENPCEAKCKYVKEECAGECPCCNCPGNYDPVCGFNGNTFTSKCEADCSQVNFANMQ